MVRQAALSAQVTHAHAESVAGAIAVAVAAAMWTTAAGGGVDTTCAIVVGIVAASPTTARPPADWARGCEPLPVWAGAPPLHDGAVDSHTV
ncbi:hypothetical protein AB0K60_07350 [Thermopolyspora sp. NPDC052614]|uniref:hypothetical protein n=1 Tax=Thermopolyspora sp. NPDC052614 TaxID=3155682 RepID=UPI003434287A